MLHLGTLVALLIYFRRTGCARPGRPGALRDRSIGATRTGGSRCCSPSRRSRPLIVGLAAQRPIETDFRDGRARRADARRRRGDPVARRAARAPRTATLRPAPSPAALGDRRSPRRSRCSRASAAPGISISAGLFAGLDREAAARFSFLMATPITAGAGLFEALQARPRRGRRREPSSARWSSGWSPSFLVGLARDRRPAPLPADALAGRLRRLPDRRSRRSSSSSCCADALRPADGGHEAAPPAGDPRPGRPAADPHPAGARRRAARARLPDDPGDDQPRRRRARAHQGVPRGDRGLRAAAAPRSRPRRPARTACASSCATCRSRSTRPACCS